jgi:hypothetical protein
MRGREIKILNLSEKEKGYLFGLFAGDGYKVYDKNSRHYHVEFYLNSVKDRDIVRFLICILNKLGCHSILYQDKRYNCVRVRVYSKQLFSLLTKNIYLKNKSKYFSLGFVSGVIDSEGHVDGKKSSIDVVNTNKRLLMEIKRFLGSMSIKTSLSERQKSRLDTLKSYRMYIPVSFKNTHHISIKVERRSR